MAEAIFRHINLVAEDWELLGAFYRDVFGCKLVPPERDISTPELEAATGIPDARLRGAHLRLPGVGEDGPTLEVFEYDKSVPRPLPELNSVGFAHLAFEVSDVARTREEVIKHGGSEIGDVVTVTLNDGSQVTFVYVRDPEDNIIELQSWGR